MNCKQNELCNDYIEQVKDDTGMDKQEITPKKKKRKHVSVALKRKMDKERKRKKRFVEDNQKFKLVANTGKDLLNENKKEIKVIGGQHYKQMKHNVNVEHSQKHISAVKKRHSGNSVSK